MTRNSRNKKSRNSRRSGANGNGNGALNLTNFGQRNRRTIIASFERDLTSAAATVIAITIGRKLTGIVQNPLMEAWFGNDQNGWPLENIRVTAIKVHFDCRGLGTVGFNARPRVGAFMSGDTLGAIDETKVASNIEQFGGMTISPNQIRVITVKVGPEFTLGRFGETGANSLVIYQRGFVGVARILVHYEVLGFPATRVVIAADPALTAGVPEEEEPPRSCEPGVGFTETPHA